MKNNYSKYILRIGIVMMVAGILDPLEGSVIILAGSALVAIGIYFSNGLYKSYLYTSFFMILFGVSAMFVLSSFGGIGGSYGKSMWWGLTILPYPVGWLIGLTTLTCRWIKLRRKTF